MSAVARARRARQSRRERGTALSEFALVVTVLLSLGLGVFEFGGAYRSSIATVSAARAAARTASSLGADPQADWMALSSLRSELQAAGLLSNVQRVVVYKSTTTDGLPPAACLPGGTIGSTACNVFTGAQLTALTASSFNATTGCPVTGAALAGNWCPNTRVTLATSADYVGVWVQTRHMFATRLFGQYQTITRYAVMREEPSVS